MTDLALKLTEARWFRGFIVVTILLAGALTGLETSATLMAEHSGLFRLLDRLVLGVFLAEIALKLIARGNRPLDYFRDGWNVFDFLIVVFCLLPGTGTFGAVLRLARVLRLLRLVTALPKLQLLVGALLKSLSAMGYVSLLLSLLFYIYAVAGVHLFGRAPADFGSIGVAMLTLFRIVTLDDWGNIFERATTIAPTFKVAIYFVSFIVFGTMIILNLFIGIILNSMAETNAEITRGAGPAAGDELGALEEQLRTMQATVQRLRHDRQNLRKGR